MPRGGQTYEVIDSDRGRIQDILQSIPRDNNEICPRMTLFDDDGMNATIIMEYTDGTAVIRESIYIKFDIERSRCYIIGTRKGRDALVRYLNRLFNPEEDVMIIRTIRLRGQSIYNDMLEIAVRAHNTNFIKILDVKFRLEGFESPLDRHRVSEIKYGFTRNICASRHAAAGRYVANAEKCRVRFGIWGLGPFQRNVDEEPMPIDVNTDYSFRFFWEYDINDILQVMMMFNIDPDAHVNDGVQP